MVVPRGGGVLWHEESKNRKIGGFVIFGYNFIENDFPSIYKYYNRKIANISYLYNYDGAPNGGWYWVDSVAESTIEFIPPVPNRDGYIFGGWYREPECVTAWDFENDVTGEEIVLEPYNYDYSAYMPYSGISLYAKWERKQ